MTQFEKSAPGAFLTRLGAGGFGRSALMYLGVIVLIGAVALIGLTVIREGSPSAQAAPRLAEVVDGWMPGITAANRAAQLEDARLVQDGWSTRLLKPEPKIVDGWASRYLVADD